MSTSPLLAGLAGDAATRSVLVLDDDPTGTQTVRDVPVLAAWTGAELAALLAEQPPIAYLLTNSRSLPVAEARRLAREIGRMLVEAASTADRPLSIVSRSDSTLRGHFPAEVDALAEGLGWRNPTILLAPYFGEGGRVTIDDTHCLRRNDRLIPVSDTEFARDPDFGYSTAHLPSWIAERAGAERPVASISLERIRRDGPEAVAADLRGVDGRVWIANAEVDADLEVVALAAARLEAEGRPLIARTAASYPRIRAGRPPADPIAPEELGTRSGPGVIVVGSHVALTTRQLERLRSDASLPLQWIELAAADVLAGREAAAEAASAVGDALAEGRTPVIATSRERLSGISLDAGLLIARALAEIVAGLERQPAWIIAKGGITSSVVATEGLGLRRAQVLGPLLPGVSAWRCGSESRWPGMPLVVFPGNVGEEETLWRAVSILRW